MINALTDLSTLTAIPDKTLEKLFQSLIYVICQNTLEDELNEVDVTEIDIGIGILYIKHDSADIRFKFVPSDSLQKSMSDVVTKKLNLMENTLTAKLSEKLLQVYKELC